MQRTCGPPGPFTQGHGPVTYGPVPGTLPVYLGYLPRELATGKPYAPFQLILVET